MKVILGSFRENQEIMDFSVAIIYTLLPTYPLVDGYNSLEGDNYLFRKKKRDGRGVY